MVYYASDLLFGDETVARKRHYLNATDMNNSIISNWNKVVCDVDTVYIIGGIGDFSFVKSLNGDKHLIMSDSERAHMDEYVATITSNRVEEYDADIYSLYLKSDFGISGVNYFGRMIRKTYSGKLVRLTTCRNSIGDGVFSVVGGLGNEYQRLFNSGLNSNIFMNGMFPISEVEVEELEKYIKNLL